MKNRSFAVALVLVASVAQLALPVASADEIADATTVQTIVPHTARYKIKISIASGTLETLVQSSGDSYAVRSVIQPSGFARIFMGGTIEERSRFVVDAQGVRPMVYGSNDQLSNDKKVMDFTFDWDAQTVSGTVNEDDYEYPLDNDVHDRVSIQYQLMHNLATGVESTRYAMLDGDEVKQLQISTIGTKEIKVPYGTFEAIGIRHQAENSKRVTTLWCAAELGYIPVLIEQHRKGKRRVRAVLTQYTPGMPGEKALSATN